MKSLIPIFTLFQFLISCSTQSQINSNSIRIDQHPFLVDHCKQLSVYDTGGKQINNVKMYCDPGEGCNSYLFETKENFIIIDCNGQWFSVNKMNGVITKETWQWERPIPDNYLGTFVRGSRGEIYSLIKEDSFTIIDIYKFKDPID
ncbi:MAG: hypothetical protein KBF42_03850 [Chitinophagales bacterium]|nr:hypothetical protein [Bacteroidota bacterium]MBK7566868.1 hypothetical protein [Bacteroidota bacterium]MBP8916171.1 hypothetical protein [Chitinophagales bacterium]MBP9220493.1 hypothetical protein [Chitinophagales bacterium]